MKKQLGLTAFYCSCVLLFTSTSNTFAKTIIQSVELPIEKIAMPYEHGNTWNGKVSVSESGIIQSTVLRSGFGQSQKVLDKFYEESCNKISEKSHYYKDTPKMALELGLFTPINKNGDIIPGFNAHVLIDPSEPQNPIHPWSVSSLSIEKQNSLIEFFVPGTTWIQKAMVVRSVYCKVQLPEFTNLKINVHVIHPKPSVCKPVENAKSNKIFNLNIKNQIQNLSNLTILPSSDKASFTVPNVKLDDIDHLSFTSSQGEVSTKSFQDENGVESNYEVTIYGNSDSVEGLVSSIPLSSGTDQNWDGKLSIIPDADILQFKHTKPPLNGTHYINSNGDIYDLSDTNVKHCFCAEKAESAVIKMDIRVDDIVDVKVNNEVLLEYSISTYLNQRVTLNKGQNCIMIRARDNYRQISWLNFLGTITTDSELLSDKQ